MTSRKAIVETSRKNSVSFRTFLVLAHDYANELSREHAFDTGVLVVLVESVALRSSFLPSAKTSYRVVAPRGTHSVVFNGSIKSDKLCRASPPGTV